MMNEFMKKDLQAFILSFDNWNEPWTFYEFISSSSELNLSDLELFREIWTKASDFNLWNFKDLALGCKSSCQFIQDNYNLTEEIADKIVRAISYQWK
jgi:hypothetical protein